MGFFINKFGYFIKSKKLIRPNTILLLKYKPDNI